MRQVIRTSALCAALFSLIFTLGPAKGALAAAQADAQNTHSSATHEAWLTKQIENRLRTLPDFSIFDNVAFQVQGTRVTLRGEVVHPVLKGQAEALVKGVEGITAVDNEIRILPASPMDDQIRRAEYRSIYGFPSLNRYALGAYPTIHIIVDSGRVKLEGAVDTQTDKQVAGLRANSVPGVFSVTNDLQVTRG